MLQFCSYLGRTVCTHRLRAAGKTTSSPSSLTPVNDPRSFNLSSTLLEKPDFLESDGELIPFEIASAMILLTCTKSVGAGEGC
jgi:hypothetical protein